MFPGPLQLRPRGVPGRAFERVPGDFQPDFGGGLFEIDRPGELFQVLGFESQRFEAIGQTVAFRASLGFACTAFSIQGRAPENPCGESKAAPGSTVPAACPRRGQRVVQAGLLAFLVQVRLPVALGRPGEVFRRRRNTVHHGVIANEMAVLIDDMRHSRIGPGRAQRDRLGPPPHGVGFIAIRERHVALDQLGVAPQRRLRRRFRFFAAVVVHEEQRGLDGKAAGVAWITAQRLVDDIVGQIDLPLPRLGILRSEVTRGPVGLDLQPVHVEVVAEKRGQVGDMIAAGLFAPGLAQFVELDLVLLIAAHTAGIHRLSQRYGQARELFERRIFLRRFTEQPSHWDASLPPAS